MSSSVELQSLINKAKTIYVVTGGKQERESSLKKLPKVERCKIKLENQINNIENIQNELEKESDSMSIKAIRLKNAYRQEMSTINTNIEELESAMKKSKKVIGEEDEKNMHQLIQYAQFISATYSHRHQSGEAGEGKSTDYHIGPSTTDVISGSYNPKRQERITGQQHQTMIEIKEEEKVQDEILDAIGVKIEEVKHIALTIGDNVQAQNEVLNNLNGKTEIVTGKLERANDRMHDIQKKISSNSGKLCSYIVCLVILLALVIFLYNIIKK
jgi:hypothetical protein